MASVTATPQASTLPATVEITHDKFTSKTDISDPTKTHNNRERNNAISEPKRIGIITTIVFLIEILLAVFLRRAWPGAEQSLI